MQYKINTPQNQQPDRFTFTDTQSSNIKIVFLPQMLRGDRKKPQLDYQSSEGQFTFRGNEINQQQSNLGLLISITLRTDERGEKLNFAFILPSINLAGQKKQDFETVAIATTRSQKIVTNDTLTEFYHKILTLKGCAEKLSFVTDYVPSADWRELPTTAWHEDGYNLMDLQRF
jgi:hypothetical protein